MGVDGRVEAQRPFVKRRPERVTDILDAALQLFADRGYAATSVADIAGAVGLTETAVYRHFASKQAILERVLEQSSQQFVSDFEEITRSAQAPADRLDRLIELFVTSLITDRRRSVLAVAERSNLSPARQAVGERGRQKIYGAFADALLEARPQLSRADARIMVRGVADLMLGLCRMDGVGEQRLIRIATDMVRGALLG